ncbi:MAG: anti-sigma factor family protein [Gemmatimonadota bacterium]
MHLDAETLERVLHGELDSRRDASVRSHLASCRACEARLAESRLQETRLFGLLEDLDHEPPGVDWDAVVPVANPGRKAGSLIAASIALVLAAGGILYALPESPLRGWINGLLIGDDVESTEPETGAGAKSGVPVSGLSVRPAGPFEVVFAAPQEAGAIRVTLVNTGDLEIRVVGAPVKLESGPDRLTVSNAGSRSSYEILVPDSAPSIRVRVGSATVLVKEGDDVRVTVPRGTSGEYLIDLTQPGS